MRDPFVRVAGEDLPVAVPIALVVVGALSTIASVEAFASASQPAPTPASVVAPIAPANATNAASPAFVAPPSSAVNAAASASAAKSGECAPVLVVFETGDSNPSAADTAKLGAIAEWLRAHPEATVRIDGHADRFGNDGANLALSHSRARAVAKVLEQAGVAHGRITARGFGAYQPLDGLPEDSSRNRRAELTIKSGDGCPETQTGKE